MSFPIWAENWTVAGRTYQNVTVTKIELDRVHISYDGGVGTFPLADLSPGLQAKFHYDPINIRAQELVKEDTERPDWQRFGDDFLIDSIAQVKEETSQAKTDLQKMIAETHQRDITIFHNIFSGKDLNSNQRVLLKQWLGCVMKNQICIGMPKNLIPLSWGNPDSDTVSTSGDGDDTETMTFGHWSSLVFISDGVIKNITQTTDN